MVGRLSSALNWVERGKARKDSIYGISDRVVKGNSDETVGYPSFLWNVFFNPRRASLNPEMEAVMK